MAMVTGMSYKQVKLFFPEFKSSIGVIDEETDEFLADHGYAVARVYKKTRTHKGKPARVPWPPAPFANIHLAAVKNSDGQPHMVVMLKNGVVLDPDGGEERENLRLCDYSAGVLWVAAIVKVK